MKGQRGGECLGDDTPDGDAHASDSQPIDAHAIDMDAIRDTLRYIESDLREPHQAELRTILKLALMEIGRIEAKNPAQTTPPFQSARYVPADT